MAPQPNELWPHGKRLRGGYSGFTLHWDSGWLPSQGTLILHWVGKIVFLLFRIRISSLAFPSSIDDCLAIAPPSFGLCADSMAEQLS